MTSQTDSQQAANPQLPPLPGMLPPAHVASAVSRWEDEGGKPARSPAERASQACAERAVLRQQRLQACKRGLNTIGLGVSSLHRQIQAHPLPATLLSLGLGWMLGRLLRR